MKFFRPYVRQVIYRYLDCGILQNGFARGRCGDCGHEYLLAFEVDPLTCPKCKGRMRILASSYRGPRGHQENPQALRIVGHQGQTST
jgi:hypothetical protein